MTNNNVPAQRFISVLPKTSFLESSMTIASTTNNTLASPSSPTRGAAPITVLSDGELLPSASTTPRFSRCRPHRLTRRKSSNSLKCRIPFKLINVLLVCLFTVGPAVALWMISWQAGRDGVDMMQRQSEQLVEEMSASLRELLVAKVSATVANIIEASEIAMNKTLFRIHGDGYLEVDGRKADSTTIEWLRPHVMYTAKAEPLIFMFQIGLLTNMTVTPLGTPQSIIQDYNYANTGFNLSGATPKLTTAIGFSTSFLNQPARNETVLSSYAVNQDTGLATTTWFTRPFGFIQTKAVNLTTPQRCGWQDNIVFGAFTGFPKILLECQIPTYDRQAAYWVVVHTGLYTIRNFLRSLLTGPKQRLFIVLRNPLGQLVAASHSDFYTGSDRFAFTDTVTPPPVPVAQLQPYTALNSSDPVVQQTGRWLLQKYGSWAQIPEFDILDMFQGEAYWVTSRHLNSYFKLGMGVFFLTDRDCWLAALDRTSHRVQNDFSSANRKNIIILACAVVGAVFCSFILSMLISWPLLHLGRQMGSLLRLDDEEEKEGARISVFTEIRDYENVFFHLDSKLRGLVRYLPRQLGLIADSRLSSPGLLHRSVTVMCMDLVGFPMLCEELSPTALTDVTSEYFQTAYEVIASSGGIITQLVGDCVLVAWNALQVMPFSPEAAACQTALRIQQRILALWPKWTDGNLPRLRFCAGINSGNMLVGNFGCESRVQFTCLGEGVTLASQLEAVNKVFGSVVLVSEQTKLQAQAFCAFRKLGVIPVLGKSRVTTVYELLYETAVDWPLPLPEVATVQLAGAPSNPLERGLRPSTAESIRTTRDVCGLRLCADASDTSGCYSGLMLESPKRSGSDNFGPTTTKVTVAPMTMVTIPVAADGTVVFHWERIPRAMVDELTIHYEQGIEFYSKGQLAEAEACFVRAQGTVPSDGASRFLIEQCQKRRNLTAAEGWDEVLRF